MKKILSEFRIYLCNYVVNKIPSHHFRLFFYKTIMKFSIGKGSYIFMGCLFDCKGNFSMGDNSVLNNRCKIDNRGMVKIGNNVAIANDTFIITADHDISTPYFEGRIRNVEIQDNVWIGTRVTIMPGITIENGAVVGVGSIVTKNIDCFNIVAGVPAKFLRKRGNEIKYDSSYKRLFQ